MNEKKQERSREELERLAAMSEQAMTNQVGVRTFTVLCTVLSAAYLLEVVKCCYTDQPVIFKCFDRSSQGRRSRQGLCSGSQ